MKRSAIAVFACIICCTANAQRVKSSEVPSSVAAVFANSFRNATDVKWEKEGLNYEASYKVGNSERSVLIDPNGALLETETEIAVSALPAAAAEYISAHFAKAKIREASSIVDPTGTTRYEAEVNGFDLLFDANGAFLRSEKANAGDKKD